MLADQRDATRGSNAIGSTRSCRSSTADQLAESSRPRIAAVLHKPPSLTDLARTVAGALLHPA